MTPIREFGVLDSNSIGWALFLALAAWAAIIAIIVYVVTQLA